MFSLASLLLGLSLSTLVKPQDISITDVETTLNESGVIPDVFPSDFTPTFPFEVVYIDSSSNALTPVTAGMNLTISQTTNEPLFAILSDDATLLGKQYLIVMVDPDAPAPPNRTISQFLHFLGANYVGRNFSDSQDILFFINNETAATVPYVAPGPPAGSIPHRYVLACYLQDSSDISIDPSTYPANRIGFNLTDFAEKRGDLTLLGATFFYLGPGDSN